MKCSKADVSPGGSKAPGNSDTKKRACPDPSCVSQMSDWSKDEPLNFRKGPGPTQPQKRASPDPSCVSQMSDWSKDEPLNFGKGPGPTQPQHRAAPDPSCVSQMSDWSKDEPLNFGPTQGKKRKRKRKPKSPRSCSFCHWSLASFSCGHHLCAQCLCSASLQTHSPQHPCPYCTKPAALQDNAQEEHKVNLKRRYESVCEGVETGSRALLKSIYTELYITEGLGEGVSAQHEVRRLEARSKKKLIQETPIRCQDIFKPLPSERQRPIRVVLTGGVAGVGKTFSVLKFTLDWAEGLENQEMALVVPLSFRELNLVRERRYSLLSLVQLFHPGLEQLTAQTLAQRRVLFIFDGLDESRLSLDFTCELIPEVSQRSAVNVLLVNLIKGTLLPSALIWITSRPAAVSQIPAHCVHRVTEVRGFVTDEQKEEYFRKRFRDTKECDRVLSHIRTSRSLHIMCQIPVFCWIISTVLEHVMSQKQGAALPQTLSDMYAHFLLVQTHRKKKYIQEASGPELTPADCELLLKLGRLAFEHLHKGNIMFYQEDLQQVGLDLTEASVYSGLCTEILKEEKIIFHKSVYCFIHLSVQEFLAAVYVVHCFNNNNTEQMRQFLDDWDQKLTLDILLRKALEKSFQSPNGHLDLCVRFLHGLSLESNCRLLRALLGPAQTDSETAHRIIQNLKEINTRDISANGSITIFHCLSEMNDLSVHQQIMDFLNPENKQEKLRCSTLADKGRMPEDFLGSLKWKRFNISDEGKWTLIPSEDYTEAALLWSGLSMEHCAVVASALKSSPTYLRELDLWLRDHAALEALCEGLKSTNCRLETLRLNYSSLSECSGASLASALNSNPTHLKLLDLNWNPELKDSGVKHLCGFLKNPDSRLQELILEYCGLSDASCAYLAPVLKSSTLKVLDLTENDLKDPGVRHLCELLQSPECRLENLRLENINFSVSSCASLATALNANPSHLRKLDLSLNPDMKDSGVELVSGFLKNPACRLEILHLRDCRISGDGCASLASALESNPSYIRDITLLWNPDLGDDGVEHLCRVLRNPKCQLQELRFKKCGLTSRSCAPLGSALESNPSCLKKLDLSENCFHPSDVEKLLEMQKSPNFRLEEFEWQ